MCITEKHADWGLTEAAAPSHAVRQMCAPVFQGQGAWTHIQKRFFLTCSLSMMGFPKEISTSGSCISVSSVKRAFGRISSLGRSLFDYGTWIWHGRRWAGLNWALGATGPCEEQQGSHSIFGTTLAPWKSLGIGACSRSCILVIWKDLVSCKEGWIYCFSANEGLISCGEWAFCGRVMIGHTIMTWNGCHRLIFLYIYLVSREQWLTVGEGEIFGPFFLWDILKKLF